jgi:hypothetical protein
LACTENVYVPRVSAVCDPSPVLLLVSSVFVCFRVSCGHLVDTLWMPWRTATCAHTDGHTTVVVGTWRNLVRGLVPSPSRFPRVCRGPAHGAGSAPPLWVLVSESSRRRCRQLSWAGD